MSGINNKDSKLSRILARQVESNEDIQNIFALIRLGHETDLATIKLLTETAHRLEAENATLRKYLGSVLFQRRKVESIPTLEPEFGNRADKKAAKACDALSFREADHICHWCGWRDDEHADFKTRHANPLPHKTAETV